MPGDANAVLQASVTKVDTFNSTGLDLGATYGNSPRELVASIRYSAASEASGSKTVIFKLQQSTAVGGTYYDLATSTTTITLTTTAQSGEILIPFLATQQFVRLVMTLSANTNSPTITYEADVRPSRP